MSRRWRRSAPAVPIDLPRWAPPLLAVQFLTRLPAPATARLTPDQVRIGLARAVGWFPLVGTLVGVCTATIMLLAELVWPRLVAVLLALIVEARLTGAFHEDAVADFCDGFGGGHDPESIQRIMRDSRIGSYGTVGLTLAIGLRVALLVALSPAIAWIAIVASATFGRLLVVATMVAVPPVPARPGPSRDVSGDVGRRRLIGAVLASVPALGAFAFVHPAALAGAVVAAALFLIGFRRRLLDRIGGSTGDCLGFAVYAGQLLFLLAATAA